MNSAWSRCSRRVAWNASGASTQCTRSKAVWSTLAGIRLFPSPRSARPLPASLCPKITLRCVSIPITSSSGTISRRYDAIPHTEPPEPTVPTRQSMAPAACAICSAQGA